VSGDSAGAMGLHYVNLTVLTSTNQSGVMEVDHPQIVIYEPTADGHLRLTGADYLVYADAWDKLHPGDPPQLMGQLFHLFDAPNRFGLPAFYTLHAWAWKDNPNGAFVNWHPNVSCEQFTARTTPLPEVSSTRNDSLFDPLAGSKGLPPRPARRFHGLPVTGLS